MTEFESKNQIFNEIYSIEQTVLNCQTKMENMEMQLQV